MLTKSTDSRSSPMVTEYNNSVIIDRAPHFMKRIAVCSWKELKCYSRSLLNCIHIFSLPAVISLIDSRVACCIQLVQVHNLVFNEVRLNEECIYCSVDLPYLSDL